jgi:hypothetical protein
VQPTYTAVHAVHAVEPTDAPLYAHVGSGSPDLGQYLFARALPLLSASGHMHCQRFSGYSVLHFLFAAAHHRPLWREAVAITEVGDDESVADCAGGCVVCLQSERTKRERGRKIIVSGAMETMIVGDAIMVRYSESTLHRM